MVCLSKESVNLTCVSARRWGPAPHFQVWIPAWGRRAGSTTCSELGAGVHSAWTGRERWLGAEISHCALRWPLVIPVTATTTVGTAAQVLHTCHCAWD